MEFFVFSAYGLATQGANTSPPILSVKLSWYDQFQHNKNAREFLIYFTTPQCLRQLLQLILRHQLWRGRWSTTFWRLISQWCIIAQYIYQGTPKYGMNILSVSWLSQGLVNSKLVIHQDKHQDDFRADDNTIYVFSVASYFQISWKLTNQLKISVHTSALTCIPRAELYDECKYKCQVFRHC